KEITTTNNQKLEDYVAVPVYTNNTIEISLKNNIGLYKFKIYSSENIEINDNSILLKNISLYAPPTPSPVNWFTWENKKIIGLTDLGKVQEIIVLPEITTSISNNVFRDNKVIKRVDMSFTQITSMPIETTTNNRGLFSNSNVETVVLPKNLINIGYNTFSYAQKLKKVKIPETVADMSGNYIFYNTPMLNNINIPNNVKGRLGYACFEHSGITSIVIPNGITILSHYCFYHCDMLSDIKLSNNLITIENFVFTYDSKLTEITLPNSITSIGDMPFEHIPNLVVFVNSDNVENLIRNVFSGSIINLNKPYKN
ncbi:MAG: leucine-rich repeat domain-containing protein, partial [Ureaplasma sp.]|nr:leucine-rich repeat domain-containing protein [Ureaplasma sp.]